MFDYLNDKGQARIGKIIGHVALVLAAAIFLLGSWGTVGAQERGVKVRLGVVRGVVNPGLYFKFPIIDKVVKMDVKTQSLTSTKEAPLEASSNDQQDTYFAVVVNYHIQPNTVSEIYSQYGGADTYYHNVVDPRIVATIKAIASQYSAAEQIQKRPELTDKTLAALHVAFDGKNVAIENADITNIAFNKGYSDSIERKAIAVQDAEAAQNKKVQTQAEADQKIITAKADAQAIQIQAQAINSQGGADYVALQKIKTWDGHSCTSYCGLDAMFITPGK